GLKQKVGNYPGVTVERKVGTAYTQPRPEYRARFPARCAAVRLASGRAARPATGLGNCLARRPHNEC
ncbi:MAG: hypothetical protein H7Z42_20555, partial [Roseiflexaceae bacterium]|nr:hypothetical protein [Roseiflexaceae bacterium]